MERPDAETNDDDPRGLSRFHTESTSAPRMGLDLDASSLSSMSSSAEEKYDAGEVVGEGGMKRVLKVRDRDAVRDVAMALMTERAGEPEYVARFVREARITANLEHPNIIPVHDIGADDRRRPYFTMKLVHGEDLAVILRRMAEGDADALREFDPGRMLTIFRKVCDAVAFAHSKGIVHLDLKPENVLVGDFGEVLVLDWGLSKIMDPESVSGVEEEDDDLRRPSETSPFSSTIQNRVSDGGGFIDATMDGVIKGTLGYMAPEQAMGRNAEKDHRADVYSLGAILYSILTLARPIDHDSPEMVLLDTTRGKIIPPRKRRPDRGIPPALEAVTMRAMALEPSARYQSVEELSRDVDAFVGGFATTAERAGLATQSLLLCKRHQREAAVLLASLATLLVLAALFVKRLNDERSAAVEAKTSAEQAELNAEMSLDKMRDERRKRMEISAKAAPEFVEKARKHMASGRWDKAWRAIDVALTLDRKSKTAWETVGGLALGDLKFEQALQAFAKADDDAVTVRLAELTRRHAENSRNARGEAARNANVALAVELEKLGADAVAARILVDEAGDSREALAVRERALEDRLKALNPGLNDLTSDFHQDRDGVALSLAGNPELRNVSPLRGLPLTDLSLADTDVIDLTPLRGMPLRNLNLAHAPISDLSPLKGMSLRRLDLTGTRVSDLRALKGMPLRQLKLAETDVADLTPLRGAPLNRLDVGATKVENLAPLKGMKLASLNLEGLDGMTSLAPLRGMPLRELNLGETGVDDLSALQGMNLKRLELDGTDVTDLTPLRGMPLERLILSGTDVMNVAPLRGMPLQELSLRECRGLSDVEPLATCAKLERLVVPEHVVEVDCLAKLPNLKYLDDHGDEHGTTTRPAFEFWRERQREADREKAKKAKIRQLRDALKSANPKQRRLRFRCEIREDGLELDLAENQHLSDLSPLKGMPIRFLCLDNTRIEDLEALRGLPLRHLSLNGAEVTDLAALEGSDLEELELMNCRVQDLSPLRRTPLERLVVGGPFLTSLRGLEGLRLRSLVIFADKISDLSPLSGMPIEELDLNCPVDDLKPLAGMKIRTLLLACPRVSDLSPLRGMPLQELRVLECDPNLDLEPLRGCPTLTRVTIPPDSLKKNVTALKALPKLRFLDDQPRGPEDGTRTATEFWRDFNGNK